MKSQSQIKIGVSSCLLGNKVRYDGKHQYLSIVAELEKDFELISFCPEMEIGLGVPRQKIQLVNRNDRIVCLDQQTYQIDYTKKLSACCDSQIEWLTQISGYILKTKSPSCGLSKVKTDHDGEIIANGQGIFAKRLKLLFPDLPLIEDDECLLPEKLNVFLDRVRCFENITKA